MRYKIAYAYGLRVRVRPCGWCGEGLLMITGKRYLAAFSVVMLCNCFCYYPRLEYGRRGGLDDRSKLNIHLEFDLNNHLTELDGRQL